MSDELTELQKFERQAMTGDRYAISQVVGALRLYRAASQSLLDARRGDGAADGASTATFAEAVSEIEQVEP